MATRNDQFSFFVDISGLVKCTLPCDLFYRNCLYIALCQAKGKNEPFMKRKSNISTASEEGFAIDLNGDLGGLQTR